jgi:hypothetical protein
MKSKTTLAQESAGTTDCTDRQITGPHLEFDQYGRPTDATYYRCETCGTEAIHRSDVESECECVRQEVAA